MLPSIKTLCYNKSMENCTFLNEDYILTTKRIAFNTDIPLIVERSTLHTTFANDPLYAILANAFGEAAPIVTEQGDDVLESIFKHQKFCILPTPVVEKPRFNLTDLMQIMDILMSENGCPWDREQTHESISKNLIEEAEEAAQAIANKDTANMQEEFGDVLLQSVFQSRIAEKNGTFTMDDVITTLCQKLIRRHTHVFGSNSAASAEEALSSWKAAKAEEKKKP